MSAVLDFLRRSRLARRVWRMLNGGQGGVADVVSPAPSPVGPDEPDALRWNVDRFEWLSERRLALTGWVFGNRPLQALVLRLGGHEVAQVPAGGVRHDVAAAFAHAPQALHSGFDCELDIDAPGRRDIDVIELVACSAGGGETSLLRRCTATAAARRRWTPALARRGLAPDDLFYFPIATSHVAAGGAEGIRETFGPYESQTVRVGIRVQILYLRTTLGAAADYVFDPDFVADKRVDGRLIAEDGLHDVIDFAVAQQMPVLFTLNGGIWADSACEAVEWDVNDALERDESLCQWNEKNQVMPDTALSDRPGSVASPQLGRSLSLNVYLAQVRHYKKRNLQQAARRIARFADEHPQLFIGVALDPDVYVNPFFEGEQWYDYNPQTLRQFRHWLRGDGPYAGQGGDGVPDLSRYRRAQPLSLEAVNALAGRRWSDWDEVDAPREFPALVRPFWKNPWVAVWAHFRRHLVQLRYDELPQWVAEAGIDAGRIYSSQGFMPPGELIDALPVRLDSPARNYDCGGMSIEGSVPTHGRLGAIVYGASAVNDIRMEGQASLFAEFRRYSPEWAVVEHNTADLTVAGQRGTLAQGYASLREIVHYGARFVSPMAWNGSPGENVGQPGFLGYTCLRRSPLEEAMALFMLERADLPRRARHWSFGAGEHADGDGWQVDGRPAVPAHPGALALLLGAGGCATMTSPGELALRLPDFAALVVRAQAQGVTVELQGQAEGNSWVPIRSETVWEAHCGGCWLTFEPADDAAGAGAVFDRIRLLWRGPAGAEITVQALTLYPHGVSEP